MTTNDLSEAISLMGEAVSKGDPDDVAIAMRRHAEALSNSMSALLIPTLQTVLETVLRAEISQVSARIDRSDSARLRRNAEFQDHIDTKFDRTWAEVDALAAAFKEGAAETKKALAAIDVRINRVENQIESIDADHELLEDIQKWRAAVRSELAHIREELQSVKDFLEQRPAQRALEHEHVAKMAAEQAIKQLSMRGR